jgi:hypothetical protein
VQLGTAHWLADLVLAVDCYLPPVLAAWGSLLLGMERWRILSVDGAEM